MEPYSFIFVLFLCEMMTYFSFARSAHSQGRIDKKKGNREERNLRLYVNPLRNSDVIGKK